MFKKYTQYLRQHKKRVLLVGIGLFVVVASGAGYIVWQKQQYSQALTRWSQAYTGAWNRSASKLKDAPKDSNTKDIALAALGELQSSLREWSTPAEPQLLGVSLVSAEAGKAKAVSAQGQKLSTAIDASKALLTYQPAISAIIDSLSGKGAQNLEQLKAIEGSWKKALADLRSVTPPAQAQEFHQQLQDKVDQINKLIVTLIPLYEKQDVAGFNAKKEEMVNKVGELQELSHTYEEIAKHQDEELAKQANEVSKLLSSL